MDLAAALPRLPFFPLAGVVLFPGTSLPLHIFEPRYRQMIGDALEGRPLLAMALPEAGADPSDPRPAVHPIAGAGRIVAHERLADGRYNIVLSGLARVRLEEIPSDRLYRVARASLLAEDVRESRVPPPTALLSLAVQITSLVRRREPRFELHVPPGLDASSLCDQLADRLVRDPETRQRILEALDVAARVDLLMTVLAVRYREIVGGHAV